MNAYDILKERGFIAQVTYEDELRKAFDEGMVTFYTGFDPTADSLHIGHYIPVMAMAHLQRAGHKPIALMGGGTGMIGDPSGKSDLRKMLTVEDHRPQCGVFQEADVPLPGFRSVQAQLRRHCQQRRLAAHAELHRLPAGGGRAVLRQPHARPPSATSSAWSAA